MTNPGTHTLAAFAAIMLAFSTTGAIVAVPDAQAAQTTVAELA